MFTTAITWRLMHLFAWIKELFPASHHPPIPRYEAQFPENIIPLLKTFLNRTLKNLIA